MTDRQREQDQLRNRKPAVKADPASSMPNGLVAENQPQNNQQDGKKVHANDVNQAADYTKDWIDQLIDGIFRYDSKTMWMTVALSLVSIVSRVWNIHRAKFVVWDEAHFGKFGSHYLKREFYFDVHPPLGKILVGLSGLLAGYKGDFDFESGKEYPAGLNYTAMRVFLSMFGAMMVPLTYLTCLEFRMSKRAAFMAAVLVLCDNAYLAISRYILLDSMLLYFTVLTFYCLSVFYNCRQKSFEPEWWFWLAATGASIGMVSSVKWVGFFVTAVVGLYTIEDLWVMFGDLKMPKTVYFKHFMARVVFLIVLPISIYMFSFWLHFGILIYSGPGDAQMSSLFQANLVGSELHSSPVMVAYQSKISLKNNGYGGGLLHSHVQTYPHGSKQQQVTCYHHKDSNNDWIVTRLRTDNDEDQKILESEEIEYLRDGDEIRLIHASTGRNLHSHPLAAPVTKTGWEVSGYGNLTIGDSNDYWKVEVVDDIRYPNNASYVRSLTTRLRFRHVPQNCYLRSHNQVLPEWGFKQAEVFCDKQLRQDLYNIWNVEQHWNDKLPAGSKSNYKTSFLKDFVHLNVGMYTSNNALTPDPDKEPDGLTSSPSEWPFMKVGLRMCGWGDTAHKVLLLGNPVVWMGSTFSLAAFVLLWTFYILRFKRGYHDWSPLQWHQFEFLGKYFLMGWVLHFIPFMIMARVTYLHHYFPALYFAILMMSFVTDHVTRLMPRTVSWIVWLLVLGASVSMFAYFAPLSYGFDGPAEAYKNRAWRPTWKVYG